MAARRKTVRIRIQGRVQGVGFRAWMRDEGTRLGLTGWVRNETDGSVAALLDGSEAAVAAMLERLHVGPPGSKVADIAVEHAEPDGGSGFHIRR